MLPLQEQITSHVKHWDCYNDEPLEYDHLNKVVKITESFAIAFTNWCRVEYQHGYDVTGRYISTEELLIKFKRDIYPKL